MSGRGPNVLVTGTPGTGKTTLCTLVAAALGGRAEHVDVSAWVKTRELYEEWDSERECYVIDEDKVRGERERERTKRGRARGRGRGGSEGEEGGGEGEGGDLENEEKGKEEEDREE